MKSLSRCSSRKMTQRHRPKCVISKYFIQIKHCRHEGFDGLQAHIDNFSFLLLSRISINVKHRTIQSRRWLGRFKGAPAQNVLHFIWWWSPSIITWIAQQHSDNRWIGYTKLSLNWKQPRHSTVDKSTDLASWQTTFTALLLCKSRHHYHYIVLIFLFKQSDDGDVVVGGWRCCLFKILYLDILLIALDRASCLPTQRSQIKMWKIF